jgi:hypothetical protein
MARVPEDFPSIEAALTAGSDDLELSGTHAYSGTLTGPLRIRGGRIEVSEQEGILLSDRVELIDMEISAPEGDAIRVADGTVLLRGLRIQAQSRAVIFEADAAGSAVDLRLASVAKPSLVISGRASPVVEDLVIEKSGKSGILINGEASPHLSRLRVIESGFAGMEVTGEASPRVFDLRVEKSHEGGVLVSGSASPELRGIKVEQCALSALEVKGSANPMVDGFHVVFSSMGGILLHEQARGTYMDLHFEQTMLSTIEARGTAIADIEGMICYQGRENGVWARDRSEIEILDSTIRRQGSPAIRLEDQATLHLEDSQIVTGSTTLGMLLCSISRLVSSLRAALVGAMMEQPSDCLETAS